MDNRLESLELQGLKTFATSTQLEFPGKITAIVGPNGSGKSNIADAIRWVLGEQSFSLLRAKKTEDMIFSGSQHRSRAGMAATTITFNNQDGWLPIDYSHVAITRQAYRDGQNEYLLNGQKVRLKDINELLSQTGLSERTYTIIGQGLVDAALALKPDERRKLFEEAAGIGLYRSRKEESLRRLESTRKNLDRVLDILTEIKPRLRSLERQAERYQEHHRLQSDLRLLLREWYGYQWHQKQQDLRNVRNAYQDQELRLHSLRKKHLEAQSKVEETREKLGAYRKELELNHGELSEYHHKLEQTTRELAIIDERQRSYTQQKDNLQIDIANLEEEIKGLESQQAALEDDVNQRDADFRAAAVEAEGVEQRLKEISQQKEQVESELSSARTARIKLETKKVQSSARLEELRNRINTLNEERKKILQSMDSLSGKAAQAEGKLVDLEKSYQDVLTRYNEQHKQNKAKAEQYTEVRDAFNRIDSQLNQHETQLTKLRTQLSLLQEAESALSGYSEGSKTLVEISRKGRLPQGIEPLSQHIVIEERFERAISAALGELTDLLVMPSHSKSVLIEYLETKGNERVALVAFESQSNNVGHQPIQRSEGVYGYANELITVDKPYQDLIDRLFSDIVVVRDATTAQKLINNLSDAQRVVTLSGLVFHSNGVLISGQSPSGKRLGRTRQQSELQADLEMCEKEVTQLSAEKTKLTSLIDSLQAELQNAEHLLDTLEEEKSAIIRKRQVEADVQARIGEQLVWHTDRLDALDENIHQSQSKMELTQAELVEINNQIQTAMMEEQRITAVVNDLPLFEVQQELNHWQAHHLIAKNALFTAQQRYQDTSDRANAAQKRLMTFQTRFDEIEKNLIEIEEKKAALKTSMNEIQEWITAIEKDQIEPISAASEEVEKSVTAMQKLEAHSQQQVIIAERQYTQLDLELSRRQDQLDHLRERIEDDFGLVSFAEGQKYGGPTPLPFNDDLIEDLPRVAEKPERHEDEIKRLKNQLRRIGAINPEAQEEYIEVKERFEFLTHQVADLEKASKDLQEVINTLDEMMETDFLKTFKSVNQEFSIYFSRLFNGGEAKLVFSEEENPVEGGVDIEARLPGRRQQGLALLSGGERSLTAVALIFALLKVAPPPFCILDEVDAMLDESNVGRFVDVLRELAKNIQVVIITHNRNTVQAADVIYGVTMGRDSTSQMISLKLEDVGDAYFA
ncbi:MAG: chromosome segregation protein SMC [Brevefilum sp.]|nr:chromosome segregation protein SMC [Brevefilum sp.]